MATIESTLRRKARLMLRLLGQKGGIAALRETARPKRERWWWYLDEYVAAQNKRTLRDVGKVVLILLAIAAAVAVAFQTVLKPDPRVVAHMDATQSVSHAVEGGDLDAALAAADKGLQEFPNDGELLIWRGTVLMLQQRTDEANAAYSAARQAYPDETSYLIARATIRTRANDISGAAADAQAAVDLAPDNAEAWLLLGGAQELNGELSKAAASYQQAADLAAAQNNASLEAMSKVRLAMLLQNAPISTGATP